jgi:single-strand DNA-binding protein
MTFQQTIIVGNLGKDAELRYLQSGRGVLSFNVAVTERWTDRNTQERKEKTNWYRCSLWGQQAETLKPYLVKGKQVMVTGTVEARAYMDNSGQPQATLELTARDVRLLGSRGDREGAPAEQGGYEDFSAPSEIGDIPF